MLDIKALRGLGQDSLSELLHRDEDRGMRTAATVVSAFAAGVGIGLVLGVLMAPRSGSETRHQIRERLRRGEGGGEDQADAADRVLGVG
jgi:hypothetical protein